MKKVMRNKKVFFTIAALVLAVSLLPSWVIANPPTGSADPPVASKINYQGQLTDGAGNPLNGTYDMQFLFYNAVSGGSQLGSTITKDDVAVTNGLFNVQLDVNQADFNGQGLWLEVMVGGETLSPRQEILPVPYALSLKPGATIRGNLTSDAIIHVENSAPHGRGLRGYATANSGDNYGVVGASASPDGFGGYFYDDHGGTGIYARSVGGAAIQAAGTGRIESTADSYIFISGNDFVKNVDYDTTRWDCQGSGAVQIWSGTAGSSLKGIYIPITVPGVLYGQDVTVEELTIYYKCQDGNKNYISGTGLEKQTNADSSVNVVIDATARRSNTATYYTLTPTGNNVLSSEQGILSLWFWLNFADDVNYIQIGGARLRLGHS